jgi:hypothetical protein
MSALKARVTGGRLVLDVPTTLPEGTEVELVLEIEDEFDAEESARLDASLERGLAQAKAGQGIPAEDLMARLRARG